MERSREIVLLKLDRMQDEMTSITDRLENMKHQHLADQFQSLLANVTGELEKGLSELKQQLLQNITYAIDGQRQTSNSPCCHTPATIETDGWSIQLTFNNDIFMQFV